ncbi:MAG: Gfo/Idh/MocA family oxidoreductase [Acidimicrobiia bacterium]|jgi:predicted dehydrogenase
MRIGLLSASAIAVPAMVEPAARTEDVELAAVAARSMERAKRFAATHGIDRAYGSYEELIADESLDAIYVSTPASLHAQWAIAALEAGRHVLCEKPFAGNSGDAKRMVDVGGRAGRVLMEAFHWRFHRFADRMIERISLLRRPITIETEFSTPIPKGDIRFELDLGGGALMDLGCYPVYWVRALLGEPTTVDAEMDISIDGVDDTTRGSMVFDDGSHARIVSSMVSTSTIRQLEARGANGKVTAVNPLAPQEGNLLTWDIDGTSGREEVGGPSTYEAQLAAFVSVVAGERPPLVSGEDSINNMAVIDEMYRKAGLQPRP